MRQFKNQVKWEFKLSLSGYGRNVMEALASAGETLGDDVSRHFSQAQFRRVEENEVVSIDQNDFIVNCDDDEEGEVKYKIIRGYRDHEDRKEVLKIGLSLEEAQKYCKDPETSSWTCSTIEGMTRTRKFGHWFDSYERDYDV